MSTYFASVLLLAMSAAPASASQSTDPVIDTGVILLLKHSNKLVATWTDAEVTHVAVAVRDKDITWVYEATPGEVRRLTLEDYRRELAEQNRGATRPMQLWMIQPDRAYDAGEQAAVRGYLNAQLGRRYSIKNYVRNQQGDGIHCAELASTALQQTGRYLFRPNYSLSPSRLVEVLEYTYAEPQPLELTIGKTSDSWCERSWKRCTGWADWCAWSCYETCTFCW